MKAVVSADAGFERMTIPVRAQNQTWRQFQRPIALGPRGRQKHVILVHGLGQQLREQEETTDTNSDGGIGVFFLCLENRVFGNVQRFERIRCDARWGDLPVLRLAVYAGPDQRFVVD